MAGPGTGFDYAAGRRMLSGSLINSMIRTILFLLAATASTLLAERPSSFLGIKWGASPEEAKRAMQARPGVKFGEDTDDYRFELTGGKFANQSVTKWVLEFPQRKFAVATVVLKGEENTESLYRDFRTQLAAKYGSPQSTKRLPGAKSQNNNGPRQQQYGTVSTWRFIPGLKDKSAVVITAELAGPNGAATSNPDQLVITIRYENESLTSAAEKNAAAGSEGAGKTKISRDDL